MQPLQFAIQPVVELRFQAFDLILRMRQRLVSRNAPRSPREALKPGIDVKDMGSVFFLI
jgi:hypothetical protein